LDLESTAIAPLTAGESPFALLGAPGRGGIAAAVRARAPARKHYVLGRELRAVTPAPITQRNVAVILA